MDKKGTHFTMCAFFLVEYVQLTTLLSFALILQWFDLSLPIY